MRFTRRGPFVVLITATLFVVPAMAFANDTDRPTLAEAVDAAWRIAMDARRAESESQRADSSLRVSKSLAADAPSLSWSREEGEWYGGARRGTSTETEIGLSWPLWMPGERRATIDASRADVAWARANLAQAQINVAAQVREAAWNIAGRQAEVDAAQSAVDTLKMLAELVKRRVDAGDLATSDLLASDAGVLDAEMARDDALRRLKAARAHWKMLTGYDAVVVSNELEAEMHIDAKSLISQTEKPPLLAAAEESLRRAEGEWAAARRSLGAPPELTLGVKEEIASRGAVGDRSLILALRVPIGLGARRDLARMNAQAAVDLAHAELALARSKHAVDLASAESDFAIASRQVEAAIRRAELLSRRQQMMQRAFTTGEISLAELLLAHRESTAAIADLAHRKAEQGVTHSRLLHAIGVFP